MVPSVHWLARAVSRNRRGYLCVLGSFLLSLALSLDYSYPNLNTYIVSYLRQNGHNPSVSYEDFIFVTAGKNLTQGLLSWLGGYISIVLGVRRTIAAGCCILIAGYTSTYWAISSSFWLVMVTVGYLHGLAFVSVYAVASGTAQRWFPPHRRGLVASIVASGYGFGAVMWIPAETAFVNPGNLAPAPASCSANTTAACSQEKYFTDPAVLENIPHCFLLLGGILTGLCAVGLGMVSECDMDILEETASSSSSSPSPSPSSSSLSSSSSSSSESLAEAGPKQEAAVHQPELPSLSMREVLSTGLFYKIWFGFFAISVTQGMLINWQKSFGLKLVTSDTFHANIGIFTNICNGVCRIVWGLLYDRFGYRSCVIFIGTCVTAGVSALPLLEYLEVDSVEVRGLWAAIMVTLYSVLPGTYAVMTASIQMAFGPHYFAANLGLLYTASLAYFSLLLVVSQVPVLFQALGYSGMFTMAGVLALLGVLVTSLVPAHIHHHREEKRERKETIHTQYESELKRDRKETD